MSVVDPLESIAAAPKAELHVHLRGAMPVEFFAQQLRKYDPREVVSGAPERFQELFQRWENIQQFLSGEPGAPERARRLFEFSSFDQFLATYLFTAYFIRDGEDFRGLVRAVTRFLAGQKTVYAEVTVSIWEYLQNGLRLEEIASILDEEAGAAPLRVRWIADLVRNIGPEAALDLLRRILAVRPRSLAGITLGGSEHLFPPAPFEPAYRLAREHGLGLSVHAGEALGPESVWDAVRVLGAERIGHGVRSVEDPYLVEYLAEREIPLEICPTSNLRTGVYRRAEEHPLRQLFEAGVPVTLSTDDPAFFGVTLMDEYRLAHELGLHSHALEQIRKNAFNYAFQPR